MPIYTCPKCHVQVEVIGKDTEAYHEHKNARGKLSFVRMVRETAPVVDFLSTLTKKDAEQFLDDCATNNLGSTYEAV